MSTEPYLVDEGWIREETIENPAGPAYRLLSYEDGTVRFEHRCDRGDRGVIVCSPALCLGPHAGGPLGTHTLTRDAEGRPTVRASVLCPDCGTHGFITDGRWS